MTYPNKVYLEPTLIKDSNGQTEYRVLLEPSSPDCVPYLDASVVHPVVQQAIIDYDDMHRVRSELQNAYIVLMLISESQFVRLDKVMFNRTLESLSRLKSILISTPRK